MAEHDPAPRTRAALADKLTDYIQARAAYRRVRAEGRPDWSDYLTDWEEMALEVADACEAELPSLLARLDAADAVVKALRAYDDARYYDYKGASYYLARDALDRAVTAWEALGTTGGDRWPHQPGRDPSAAATLARLPVLDDPAISEALAAPDDDEETGGGDGQ